VNDAEEEERGDGRDVYVGLREASLRSLGIYATR